MGTLRPLHLIFNPVLIFSLASITLTPCVTYSLIFSVIFTILAGLPIRRSATTRGYQMGDKKQEEGQLQPKRRLKRAKNGDGWFEKYYFRREELLFEPIERHVTCGARSRS
jgi:hypothetical protein